MKRKAIHIIILIFICLTSAIELKSDCCSKPKRRIKTPPRIFFMKRLKKIHIKESNPETVAETKKNNKYFESKSKSYTLKYLNGQSRELLAMPSMKITYEDNLAEKSYLCAEYQTQKNNLFVKKSVDDFDFPVPKNVSIKLISNNSSDGLIIIGDNTPDCQNIPTTGYSTNTIPLSTEKTESTYTYFYYKIGSSYGVGRVKNKINIQQQGDAFTIKLRMMPKH